MGTTYTVAEGSNGSTLDISEMSNKFSLEASTFDGRSTMTIAEDLHTVELVDIAMQLIRTALYFTLDTDKLKEMIKNRVDNADFGGKP